MDALLDTVISYWWAAGLIMSLLWGLRAVALFPDDKHPRWGIFYQFVFNFAGCLAGWCCVYALAVRMRVVLPSPQNLLVRGGISPAGLTGQAQNPPSFTGGDFLLFLMSFLGVTGHLPQAMAGLVSSIEKLAEAAAKKISG